MVGLIWAQMKQVAPEAFRKVDPRVQWHNPVLFLVWCGAALTTVIAVAEPFRGGPELSGGAPLPAGYTGMIALWLWLTVLTANVAESVAEGRGQTQVAALLRTHETATARRVHRYDPTHDGDAERAATREVDSAELKPGDIVIVITGDVIPGDGEIIWGIASVDESAITGESAPVIRESGTNRSAVTGGTRVLSDRIVVRIVAPYGQTLVHRMITLAKGARRQKAPNELALNALIASLSVSFMIVALTINVIASPVAPAASIPVLVAMLTCLVPTALAALLSVTGISGLYRLLHASVVITPGHTIGTANDVTTVLLDKTGTITKGDRRASDFIPLPGVSEDELSRAAVLSSLEDPTPEGISTIKLARSRGADVSTEHADTAESVPFSAQTRMSGRDLPDGSSVRKGAQSAILNWLKSVGTQQSGPVVNQLKEVTAAIGRSGGTPIVVAVKPSVGSARALGVIHLKDVVKDGIPDRIARLRTLGVRTVMITGDNPITAAAIAHEAGIDDYLGDATPEDKLAFVKQEQAAGHFVAMSGDGTNDAPALAQADIGVAMNTATTAAKKAANMIVRDDDPTKLIEIIEIGWQQMATRGALTTFSIANDFVKYFAIVPAIFMGTFPGLDALNIMGLHSPASAVLSTVVFNALVIGVLIPLAVLGVPYQMANLSTALNRNLLIYGLSGIIVPLVGIKLIDVVISLIPGY